MKLKPLVLLFSLANVSQAADLSDLYQQAASVSTDLSVNEKNLQISSQNLSAAYQVLYPTLSSQISTGYNKMSEADEGTTKYGIELGVQQNLFNLTALKQLEILKLNEQAAQVAIQAQQQALQIQLAESFINVVKAQAAVALAENELTTVNKSLQQTQERFEVGLLAMTDVRDAEASVASTEAGLLQRQIQLQNAELRLNTLVQDRVMVTHQLDIAALVESLPTLNLETLIEQANDSNAQLLSAKINLAVSQQQAESLKTEHKPFLAAAANYAGQTTTGDADDWTNNLSIGLSVGQQHNDYRPALSASLGYAWADYDMDDEIEGALNASIALSYKLNWYTMGQEPLSWSQQAIRTSMAQQQLIGAQRQIEQSIALSLAQYQGSDSGLIAQQKLVLSRQAALEATEAGYKVGARNVVELLNAQRALFAAQNALTNAQYDMLLSYLRVRQSAGIISIDDLTMIDSYLR